MKLLLALFATAGLALQTLTPPADNPDLIAILIAPCESAEPVVAFVKPSADMEAVFLKGPPTQDLLYRLKRTKRARINLPCPQEAIP